MSWFLAGFLEYYFTCNNNNVLVVPWAWARAYIGSLAAVSRDRIA